MRLEMPRLNPASSDDGAGERNLAIARAKAPPDRPRSFDSRGGRRPLLERRDDATADGHNGKMTLDGFPAGFFERADPSADGWFYSWPRLVQHIDDHAIALVGRLY